MGKVPTIIPTYANNFILSYHVLLVNRKARQILFSFAKPTDMSLWCSMQVEVKLSGAIFDENLCSTYTHLLSWNSKFWTQYKKSCFVFTTGAVIGILVKNNKIYQLTRKKKPPPPLRIIATVFKLWNKIIHKN